MPRCSRCRRFPGLDHVRLPQELLGQGHQLRLVARVVAPVVEHAPVVEAHGEALVGPQDLLSLCAVVDAAGLLGREVSGLGRRDGSRRRSSARREHAVRLQVVRLPQGARVGRDSEAADLDSCCARPTARAATAAPATTALRSQRSSRRAAVATRGSGTQERDQHEPGVPRIARPQTTPSNAASRFDGRSATTSVRSTEPPRTPGRRSRD